jgi:nucleoside-diphosphate-sugar epimerase
VEVIVSAVGNNQVTVLGQKNLIDAAKQQGVKRFIYEEKRLNIDEMKAKGAGIIEGDLMKPETLLRACDKWRLLYRLLATIK